MEMRGAGDIYSDLGQADLGHNWLNKEVERLEKENNSLEEHIVSLKSDVDRLCTKLVDMKKVQDNLAKNISELFKTAKAELVRKDRVIAELRSQLQEKAARPQHHGAPYNNKNGSVNKHNARQDDSRKQNYYTQRRARSRSRSRETYKRPREENNQSSTSRYYENPHRGKFEGRRESNHPVRVPAQKDDKTKVKNGQDIVKSTKDEESGNKVFEVKPEHNENTAKSATPVNINSFEIMQGTKGEVEKKDSHTSSVDQDKSKQESCKKDESKTELPKIDENLQTTPNCEQIVTPATNKENTGGKSPTNKNLTRDIRPRKCKDDKKKINCKETKRLENVVPPKQAKKSPQQNGKAPITGTEENSNITQEKDTKTSLTKSVGSLKLEPTLQKQAKETNTQKLDSENEGCGSLTLDGEIPVLHLTDVTTTTNDLVLEDNSLTKTSPVCSAEAFQQLCDDLSMSSVSDMGDTPKKEPPTCEANSTNGVNNSAPKTPNKQTSWSTTSARKGRRVVISFID